MNNGMTISPSSALNVRVFSRRVSSFPSASGSLKSWANASGSVQISDSAWEKALAFSAPATRCAPRSRCSLWCLRRRGSPRTLALSVHQDVVCSAGSPRLLTGPYLNTATHLAQNLFHPQESPYQERPNPGCRRTFYPMATRQ